MTVEVVNTIGDFDLTLPANGDLLAEGDDHIRNVKKGVLGSFAGKMDTAITTTDDQFNFLNTSTSDIQTQLDAITTALNAIGSTPIGGIIMYNGAFVNIPANFQLCDGTNGTPDLTDKFVYGTNIEIELNNTGGTADSVNISHSHTADHSHTGTVDNNGAHVHVMDTTSGSGSDNITRGISGSAATQNTQSAGDHNHTFTTDVEVLVTSTDGVAGAGLNIPPYVKLAYIRRMS